MSFTVYNAENAPEGAKEELAKSQKGLGWIPNLHGVLAESPAALSAYKSLGDMFTTTGFSADELTVIWQTINVENECHYCVPAHTAVAKMMKAQDSISEAIRAGNPLGDAKLQTLRETTLAMVQNRGHLSEDQLTAFFAAGYSNKHLLDILVGLAQKTISNYANHLADTPLDDAFKDFV